MEYTLQTIISVMISSVSMTLWCLVIPQMLRLNFHGAAIIFLILSIVLISMIPSLFKKARYDKYQRILSKRLSDERITVSEYYKNKHRFNYW